MVRVFYEPPPGGPRTHLNRGGYYRESALMPTFLKKWSKAPGYLGIGAPVMGLIMLCYVPLSKYFLPDDVLPLNAHVLTMMTLFLTYLRSVNQKNLPVTMEPEYLAAQRAYMRYHNMNPIYGVSSKQGRASDPEP
jgi:hypothetical protein